MSKEEFNIKEAITSNDWLKIIDVDVQKGKELEAIRQLYDDRDKLLVQRISELEAKLAEKETEYNKLQKLFDATNKSAFTLEELRKIILEGEESSDKKVIEMLNNEVAYLQKQCEINQDVIDLMQQNKDRDKISFAVEQLEKVKETTECVLDNALKNSSLNQSYYDRLLDEIDNQIKAIKGEK